ncbi:MAG: hypothetical protein AAF658_09945 [Myxococcota bacterium]
MTKIAGNPPPRTGELAESGSITQHDEENVAAGLNQVADTLEAQFRDDAPPTAHDARRIASDARTLAAELKEPGIHAQASARMVALKGQMMAFANSVDDSDLSDVLKAVVRAEEGSEVQTRAELMTHILIGALEKHLPDHREDEVMRTLGVTTDG